MINRCPSTLFLPKRPAEKGTQVGRRPAGRPVLTAESTGHRLSLFTRKVRAVRRTGCGRCTVHCQMEEGSRSHGKQMQMEGSRPPVTRRHRVTGPSRGMAVLTSHAYTFMCRCPTGAIKQGRKDGRASQSDAGRRHPANFA
jgi:hypothetical protein